MAEFSKQYTQRNDPEFPYDFDIFEIAESLENGYYTPIICEGFGFIAIGKDAAGEIILAMPTGNISNDDLSEVEWKNISQIIN
jgi:hypothetical protein